MKKRFTQHSDRMTNADMSAVKPMIQILKNRNIPKHRIRNWQIINKMEIIGEKVNEPSVRRIIQFIRNNSMLNFVVASQKGYYVSKDFNVALAYIQNIRKRGYEMIYTAEKMEDKLYELYGKNKH